MLKRALEAGLHRLGDRPEVLKQALAELRLPKEALLVLLSQLDETKNGLYRAVAREVRDFLERSNVSDELARVLTKLSFEIRTEVRFVPNKAGQPRPTISSQVRAASPQQPDATEPPGEAPSEAPRVANEATPTTDDESKENDQP